MVADNSQLTSDEMEDHFKRWRSEINGEYQRNCRLVYWLKSSIGI